ncbi:MAG: hypothetical protein QNJ06_18205 [Kiloniellales bacterium]|nr:hypothetical protein [Kiloniellales bacterium]MDJ0983229.1 hypothetical protein [Kiloniellales bacterium]
MNETAEDRPDTGQAVGAYKSLLKTFLERRPSGTRQRIAEALGTHKSFVSQITNPNYRVPLPAQHVASIMKICHFSPEERRAFLAAYRKAHPQQAVFPEEVAATGRRVVQIEIPAFDDPKRQAEVAEAIEELARRLIALARNDERS